MNDRSTIDLRIDPERSYYLTFDEQSSGATGFGVNGQIIIDALVAWFAEEERDYNIADEARLRAAAISGLIGLFQDDTLLPGPKTEAAFRVLELVKE